MGDALLKALEVFKNIPFWLMSGCSIAAGIFLFNPVAASSIPKENKPLVVIAFVVFSVLAVCQAIGLLIVAAKSWRAAAKTRKSFFLTPHPQQSFWSSAKQNDGSTVTQIAVRMLVRNRTEEPLRLTRARLVWPIIWGEVLHDDVLIRSVGSNIYGSSAHSGHAIPPNASLPVSLSIMIRGTSIFERFGSVRTVIGVLDDNGQEQKVALTLRVPGRQRIISPSQATELETLYSIANAIERDVAAVLQSELVRYDRHNRSAGGLGSVHMEYEGRPMTGVGATDSWNPNSPNNRLVVGNPDAAVLRSDNLDALLALYERSESADQEQIVAALIVRLSPTGGYLRVSYFIVAGLFRMGLLSVALEKAASLSEETLSFGLGNIRMLLGGLLRYRHSDFTDDMLNATERFASASSGNEFAIRQKIAAIRAQRLRAS